MTIMKLKISDLPRILRTVHESQEKWREDNWSKTLNKHKGEIESLLENIELFDNWQNVLQNEISAKLLIPEIFSDAWISIHLSCYGLYRYANMCLRSELENVLRLIYFSNHPIEFNWWKSDNDWYRESAKATDVWGSGYNYFSNLENIKRFDRECTETKRLFTGKGNISKIHKKLSKYIHGSAGYFQTRTNEFSPKYKKEEFCRWFVTCKKILSYSHILLVLGFLDKFKEITRQDRKKILELGIQNYYRKKLIKIFDLDV